MDKIHHKLKKKEKKMEWNIQTVKQLQKTKIHILTISQG